MSGKQGGEPDEGIQLKKELYWPANSEVHLGREDRGIFQVDILGKTAFYQEKKEE